MVWVTRPMRVRVLEDEKKVALGTLLLLDDN